MSKVFIDTNILVYSLDKADPNKQKICRALIKSLAADNRGVISTRAQKRIEPHLKIDGLRIH